MKNITLAINEPLAQTSSGFQIAEDTIAYKYKQVLINAVVSNNKVVIGVQFKLFNQLELRVPLII